MHTPLPLFSTCMLVCHIHTCNEVETQKSNEPFSLRHCRLESKSTTYLFYLLLFIVTFLALLPVLHVLLGQYKDSMRSLGVRHVRSLICSTYGLHICPRLQSSLMHWRQRGKCWGKVFQSPSRSSRHYRSN